MLRMAKPAKFISVWCSILTLTMLVAYQTLRIFTICVTDKASVNQDRLCIYPAYFPFDIRSTSRLLIINSAQVIAGYSDTLAYTTVDTFIAMLIMHICGQFEILKKKLLRLMDRVNDRQSKSMTEFRKELALIIDKHEQLNGWITYLTKIVIFQRYNSNFCDDIQHLHHLNKYLKYFMIIFLKVLNSNIFAPYCTEILILSYCNNLIFQGYNSPPFLSLIFSYS